MEILKISNYIYDSVTLPGYFLAQKPWKTLAEAKKIRAVPKKSNDSSPVWSSTDPEYTSIVDEHDNLDSYVRAFCKLYSEKRALGRREVVHEEEEVQPDGKVFLKKVLMPEYKWITFAQMDQKINDIAQGFIELGIQPKENVVIFMETRMEWLLSMLALLRMGAVVATLYATLGEEGIVHGINVVEASSVITSESLLPKLKRLASKLPNLKRIIYARDQQSLINIETEKFESSIQLLTIDQVEETGKFSLLPPNSHKPGPKDLAVIMFTSGSTGTPKGVLIDHSNLMGSQKCLYSVAGCVKKHGDETYIAYLPLAHIFELTVEFIILASGGGVGYSSPFTITDKSPGLKPGCKGDLTALRPSFMCAVPLVLDKVRNGILDGIKAKGKTFTKIFEYAVSYKTYWKQKGYATPVMNKVLFDKIRQVVGGKLNYMWVGGAALSPETHAFMSACLDTKICQGYGATETMGANLVQNEYDLTTGRVGPPVDGVQVKLIPWAEGGYYPTDKPNPRGEIVIGGACVAQGYYKDKEQTEEAFYEENGVRWFKTGDIGSVDPDGAFRIVDRRKDIIKLQFGEFISLGKIETTLKSSEFVENVCVYGNSYQNYVIALVMPNRPALLSLAKSIGKSEDVKFEDLCVDPQIVQAVEESMKKACKASLLNKHETPQKILICSKEWTPDSGLLTAAMKIRRKQIYDHYEAEIKALYGLDANCNVK